jgi:enoyl-CoA hydratase
VRARIDGCFGAASIAGVLDALAAEPSGWGAEQLALLRRHSPFAVRLTFEQLRRGATLGFDDAIRLEYRIVHRVFAQGDFHEGVRALLVDKDRDPRWAHPSIEAVPGEVVEACFAPLADPAQELALDWRPG